MFTTRLAECETVKIVKNGSLYAGPSMNARIIGEVKKGTFFDSPVKMSISGNCWYSIGPPNGESIGYVQCTLVEEITEDRTYPKKIGSNGIEQPIDNAIQVEIGEIANIAYHGLACDPEHKQRLIKALKELDSKFNGDRIKAIQQLFYFLDNPTPRAEESLGAFVLFYYFQFSESEMLEATAPMIAADEHLESLTKEYSKFTKGKIRTFEQSICK